MATWESKISMSKHAGIRCQQRSIPPLIIDWLVQFGVESYDGHGAIVRHFDRAGLRRLASYAGASIVSRLSEWLDAYIVTCGGTVITAGHRYKKVRRR